ncbi:MAG: PQQ-binding-like beta-propeller repeat protein [bacterium]
MLRVLALYVMIFLMTVTAMVAHAQSPAITAFTAKDYAKYLTFVAQELTAPQAATYQFVGIALARTDGWDAETGKLAREKLKTNKDGLRQLEAAYWLARGDLRGMKILFLDGPAPGSPAEFTNVARLYREHGCEIAASACDVIYSTTASGNGIGTVKDGAKARAGVQAQMNTQAPATPAVPDAWPMEGHDAQRTGRSQFSGPKHPKELWDFQVDCFLSTVCSPCIDTRGNLYMIIVPDELCAYSPDGKKLWEFHVPNSLMSSPAIGLDGTIYVRGDKLYAISPDGKLKWTFDANGSEWTSPAIGADNTVYAGADKLYAINPDGTQKWAFSAPGGKQEWTAPAIGIDGTIYAGVGKLYAINPEGTQKWVFAGDTEWLGCNAISVGADGIIYASSRFSSRLYAITTSGIEKWRFNIENSSRAAISADGTIYIISRARLIAISSDGKQKWSHEVAGIREDNSPTVDAEGTIFICGNKLYAINPDGTGRWEYPCNGRATYYPTIGADGILYFGTGGGSFYAIGNNPISITPDNATVKVGATQQFTADAKGLVIWKAEGGTITAEGIYTAGDKPGYYNIFATCGKDVDKAWVTVVEKKK